MNRVADVFWIPIWLGLGLVLYFTSKRRGKRVGVWIIPGWPLLLLITALWPLAVFPGFPGIMLSLVLLSAVPAGVLVGERFGRSNLGMLVGLAVPAVSLAASSGLLLLLFVCWQPVLPPCPSGKCKRYRDYERAEKVEGGWNHRCRCGTEYFLEEDRQAGITRFMVIIAGGVRRPYMKRTPWGRWKPDREVSA